MKQEAVLTLDEIALADLMEQGFIALQDGNRAKARVCVWGNCSKWHRKALMLGSSMRRLSWLTIA